MLDTMVFISDLILTVKYEYCAILISNSIHKNGKKINTHKCKRVILQVILFSTTSA